MAGQANRRLVAARAASAAATANAAARPQALAPGMVYGAPDWLESFDGASAMPTPGENGYGPEPSLAAMPYGSVGGVGAALPPTASSETPTRTITDHTSDGAPPLTSDAAYNWLIAWIVLGVILALIIRTAVGYRIAYYALALTLLFLLVTNATWIASALAPFNDLQATKVSGQ